MSFEYNPNDFVLIFQNSNAFDSIYRFIHVQNAFESAPVKSCFRDAPIKDKILYETANPTGLYLEAANGQTYVLNIGSAVNKCNGGDKSEWVNKGINSFLFDKTQKYLYYHKGSMGFYDFTKKTFVEFLDKNIVYRFFYYMMRLTDKPVNYQVCEKNVVDLTTIVEEATPEEKAEQEAELDAYSDEDDDNDEDDSSDYEDDYA